VSLRFFCSTRRVIVSLVLAASAAFFNPTLPGAAKGAPPPNAPALAPPLEYVMTFADDCVTPKTTFSLGETVCAEAGGFPAPLAARFRRFQWGTPDGFTAGLTNIKVDPQKDKFILPTTGQFAQYGSWTVSSIDADSDRFAVARFLVRNPKLPFANITLAKVWPDFVYPGETISHKIWINNPGPDLAETVEIIDDVPTNMVFVALKQESGAPAECTTPLRGQTGRSICKVSRLSGDQAVGLVVYYQVNSDAKEGIACVGTSQVSSVTADQNKEDNVATSQSTVTQRVVEN
jgi:uncharacterized repeat protein (TIGR01451 family)